MNEMGGCDAPVQALLDKQEIYEVLMRYCRAIDRCDEPLLRSLYHPDATDDHGVFNGKASDFCDWIMPILWATKSSAHNISNVLIEVEGDVAYSEAYFVAYNRIDREGEGFDSITGGRYIDRFERRNGVWKIAERHVVYDWNRTDPTTDALGTGLTGGDLVMGRRGPEDLVYMIWPHK